MEIKISAVEKNALIKDCAPIIEEAKRQNKFLYRSGPQGSISIMPSRLATEQRNGFYLFPSKEWEILTLEEIKSK